jgi:hypothetical protein
MFGGGYLVSRRKAAELRAAELRKTIERVEWELSAREKYILDLLDKGRGGEV